MDFEIVHAIYSKRRGCSVFSRKLISIHLNRNRAVNSMLGAAVEYIGKSTLRHLEYLGGLTIQVRRAIASLKQTLPLVGNSNRWRSAIRQMLAVGVDAFPMVGIMAICSGLILAMQGASELRRFGAT